MIGCINCVQRLQPAQVALYVRERSCHCDSVYESLCFPEQSGVSRVGGPALLLNYSQRWRGREKIRPTEARNHSYLYIWILSVCVCESECINDYYLSLNQFIRLPKLPSSYFPFTNVSTTTLERKKFRKLTAVGREQSHSRDRRRRVASDGSNVVTALETL